ncbi:2OG-Fe(II) oxygenase [Mycobacterium sp.]|jgi:prolyl 4-hydroxylase|uniref:2OG-Fe(II) oxygenase n=1 Tax=Mycobacterium sp. TaxID=1785 RepID=UPI002CAC2C5D|nr:2OG-Fe(II) oxygenase [Mycobacterium sp.]HXB86121.1 2OG-Fe(II) oxygenase [Mycobacterium sp.]
MSLRLDLDRTGMAWSDGYLDAAETEEILYELKFVWWRRSQVVRAGQSGGLESFVSASRTSQTSGQCWFNAALMYHLLRIETRLCSELRVDPTRLETWQAVRYGPGERFGLHHDAGLFGSDPAGERVLTVVLFLDTPQQGGATYFPDLDLLVDAQPGRLLVWNNLSPDGSIDSTKRHASTPVHCGTKTILTTWSRQSSVRSVEP